MLVDAGDGMGLCSVAISRPALVAALVGRLGSAIRTHSWLRAKSVAEFALVAQRPEGDARVVPVAGQQFRRELQDPRRVSRRSLAVRPSRRRPRPRHRSPVRRPVEQIGQGRIVRSPHGVEVRFLHQHQVLPLDLRRHRPSHAGGGHRGDRCRAT